MQERDDSPENQHRDSIVQQFIEEIMGLDCEKIDFVNREISRLRTEALSIILTHSLNFKEKGSIIMALVTLYDRILRRTQNDLAAFENQDDNGTLEARKVYTSRIRIFERLIVEDPVSLMTIKSY